MFLTGLRVAVDDNPSPQNVISSIPINVIIISHNIEANIVLIRIIDNEIYIITP